MVLTASLNISLVVEWERRRTTRGSRIADDLTHNMMSACSMHEIHAMLEKNIQYFPRPIRTWMMDPKVSVSLGNELVEWVGTEHDLPFLSC